MLRLTLAALVLITVAHPVAAAAPNPVNDWRTDPGLKHVPTDSFLFVSVKVSKLWNNPAAKPFRDWAAAQTEDALASLVGVAPADIDRITLVLPAIPYRGESFLFVTSRKPFDPARALKNLNVTAHQPRPASRLKEVTDPDGRSRRVAVVDDRTLLFLPDLVGPDESNLTFLAQTLGPRIDGPLAAALSAAGRHDLVVGIDVSALRDAAARQKEPSPFARFLKAKTAVLTVDLDRAAHGKLDVVFPDPATAKAAGPALETEVAGLCKELVEGVRTPWRLAAPAPRWPTSRRRCGSPPR